MSRRDGRGRDAVNDTTVAVLMAAVCGAAVVAGAVART